MKTFLGCAACFGQSDSAMAAGMNWGIMSLLGMIIFVLGGVAGFFVFLMRRSTAMAKKAEALATSANAIAKSSLDTGEGAKAHALEGRGSFGQVSALARRRKRCVRSDPESGHLVPSRGRD